MIKDTKNPLMSPPEVKHNAAAFQLIKPEHFIPAIQQAITEAKTNVEKIKANPEAPTFENTLVAFELSGLKLNEISGIYFNLLSAEATEEIQQLAQEISPLLSAYRSDISLDDTLFKRVKTVYENKPSLSEEQQMLLREVYSDFIRNGALLSEEEKQKLRAIDDEISVLAPKFNENVLKATNHFELVVQDEKDLDGIPQSAVSSAKALAETKNQPEHWIFTLQMPSSIPFLGYCKNRNLRKKMTEALSKRAFKDDFDNQENVKKIASLYAKRANLLGYKTYAEYTLQKRMAETPERVVQFLAELIQYSKPAALNEIKELTDFAKAKEGIDKIESWDVSYFINQLKKQKFNFDEEELRPYFKLENVISGAFEHASRLYEIEFKKSTDYPVYHKDVTTYEVYKKGTDEFVGLFYTDFFPRATKQGGAWMTLYKEQGLSQEGIQRPHVSIVCNFTPSTKEQPSLLTYNEVRTLFHEFGHGLHGLLSNCTYQSLAGTNVYWDFVELPSQIMENWTLEKEGLQLFAKHFETDEVIPDELIQKLKDTSQFMSGYYSMRQLEFATLDMKWFNNETPEDITDIEIFEQEATKDVAIIPRIPDSNKSCSFGHIFGGGYSAGYYSYKWAEVLDADAFELFQEKGIFNTDVARSFKNNILSQGGTKHPMELYKQFRGREPDTKALLRRDGLI